jgi:hypothetical protein
MLAREEKKESTGGLGCEVWRPTGLGWAGGLI